MNKILVLAVGPLLLGGTVVAPLLPPMTAQVEMDFDLLVGQPCPEVEVQEPAAVEPGSNLWRWPLSDETPLADVVAAMAEGDTLYLEEGVHEGSFDSPYTAGEEPGHAILIEPIGAQHTRMHLRGAGMDKSVLRGWVSLGPDSTVADVAIHNSGERPVTLSFTGFGATLPQPEVAGAPATDGPGEGGESSGDGDTSPWVRGGASGGRPTISAGFEITFPIPAVFLPQGVRVERTRVRGGNLGIQVGTGTGATGTATIECSVVQGARIGGISLGDGDHGSVSRHAVVRDTWIQGGRYALQIEGSGPTVERLLTKDVVAVDEHSGDPVGNAILFMGGVPDARVLDSRFEGGLNGLTLDLAPAVLIRGNEFADMAGRGLSVFPQPGGVIEQNVFLRLGGNGAQVYREEEPGEPTVVRNNVFAQIAGNGLLTRGTGLEVVGNTFAGAERCVLAGRLSNWSLHTRAGRGPRLLGAVLGGISVLPRLELVLELPAVHLANNVFSGCRYAAVVAELASDLYNEEDRVPIRHHHNLYWDNATDILGGTHSSGDVTGNDPYLDTFTWMAAEGSAAIDAGQDLPVLGPVDLAGNPRKVGGAPDIGAVERQ